MSITSDKHPPSSAQNFNDYAHSVPAIQDVVICMDTEGKILSVNNAFADIYNRTPDSFEGVDAFEHLDAVGLHTISVHRKQMLDLAIRLQAQVSLYDEQDGKTWKHSIYPMISGGNVAHVFIVVEDVSSIRETESDLTEYKRHLQQVLTATRSGTWRWEIKTGEGYWSPEKWALFGLEPGPDCSFDFWLGRIHPDDRQEIRERTMEDFHQKRELNFEYRVLLPDGSQRWLWSWGNVIDENNAENGRYIGITTDVTENRQNAIARQFLEQQLQQSQKMEVLGQLAGGIAHDVNNVLAAIQGNTELVLRALSPDHPSYQNLVSVTHSVNRSADMVRQLLAFARKQPVSPKSIELDTELEKMSLLFRKLIRADISFRWQLHCPHLKVCLDPASLVQIVTNLCINARDAIEGHGAITLRTTSLSADDCAELQRVAVNPAGSFVRIRITDTGTGIEPNALPHIFEPFFTTKAVGKGTGLGLSMVYGLVRQNNGYVTCQSQPGNGTTFDLYFPIERLAVPSNEAREQTIEPTPAENPLVLVVEDEPDILKIIRTILEQGGFEVLTAENAEEAIVLSERYPKEIRLTISDIVLHGMNGVQMSRLIGERNPGMKFLFMSGYSAETLGEYGNFSETANFISKPFSINRFLAMVRTVLQKKGPQSP